MKSWDQMFSVQDEVTRGDVVSSPLDRPDLLMGGRNYLRADYPGMADYPNKVTMMDRINIISLKASDSNTAIRTFPIKGGEELLSIVRFANDTIIQLNHYKAGEWTRLIDSRGNLTQSAEPRVCYNEARGLAFVWYNTAGVGEQAHWITEPGLQPTKYDSNQPGSIDDAIRGFIYEPYAGRTITGACFNKAGDVLYLYSPHHGLIKVTQAENGNWDQISILSSDAPEENRNSMGVAHVGLETVEDIPTSDPAYGNIILSSGMALVSWDSDGNLLFQGKHQEDIHFSYNSLTSTYKMGYERILIKNRLVVTRDRISLDGGLSWNYHEVQHSHYQNIYYNYAEDSGDAIPENRQALPIFVYGNNGDIYCIGGVHLLSNQLTVLQIKEDGSVIERGNYIHFISARPILEYYDVDPGLVKFDMAHIFINHSLDKKGGMAVRYRLDEASDEKGVKIYSPLTEDPSQFYVPRLKGVTDRMGNTITKVKVKDVE